MNDTQIDLYATLNALMTLTMGLWAAQATVVVGSDEQKQRAYLDDTRDALLRASHTIVDGVTDDVAQALATATAEKIRMAFDNLRVEGLPSGTA